MIDQKPQITHHIHHVIFHIYKWRRGRQPIIGSIQYSAVSKDIYCPLLNAKFPTYPIRSKLPTLTNITNVENACLGDIMFLQRLLQFFRRFKDILFGKNPCPPVHSQGFSALGVLKDVDRVMRVCVQGAHNTARLIRRDWNQAQVKRPSEPAHLLERGTNRKVVLRCVVVDVIWKVRDCSVARVPVRLSC